MKRTAISDKLREVVAAIEQRGSANLTRLTVIKKWLEVPGHLPSFAIFIADHASRRKTKTTKEAGKLIRDARALLADVDLFAPNIPRETATRLHASLQAFQNEQRNVPWGAVRIIRDHNLFLIECGLHIYLGHRGAPAEGYRLAAHYCENYDPRYGSNLNGPSRRRLREIIDFMRQVEARDKASG
jgi:hypothetical protein